MKYAFYRLKDTEENARRLFMTSSYLQMTGSWPPKPAAYEKIYEGTVSEDRTIVVLEDLYTMFNQHHPKDFRHHSMSVGDIIVLTDTKEPGAHFCDPIGFTEVPEFYAALNNERS